jgi:REP element-mobilizing transposase RayT
MARPLRIEVPGCFYHVTARGNERRAIFRADADRRRFLELLGESTARFDLRLHAYVLMDNHYHLLLQLREANLSRAMQWLGVCYTGWFNRRHRRVGHLFQGRFHAVALEEAAAGEVGRYVHLNPVRVRALGWDKTAQQQAARGTGPRPPAALIARRIRTLRQYRWSSYRAYAGWAPVPKWLTVAAGRELISGAGQSPGPAARCYREFVEQAARAGWPESPWQRLEAQVLLGGAEFVARMREVMAGNEKEQPALRQLRRHSDFAQVRRAVAAARGEPWEAWRDRYGDWGRDAVLYLGRKRCGMSLRELGEAAGGIDYRSVSSALRKFQERLARDKGVARQLNLAEGHLQKGEM